jgi:hypothetical protein
MASDFNHKRGSWLIKPTVRWIVFALLFAFQSIYFGWLVGPLAAFAFLVLDLLCAARARKLSSDKHLFWGRLASLFVALSIAGILYSFLPSEPCGHLGNCPKPFQL